MRNLLQAALPRRRTENAAVLRRCRCRLYPMVSDCSRRAGPPTQRSDRSSKREKSDKALPPLMRDQGTDADNAIVDRIEEVGPEERREHGHCGHRLMSA
jgi:hypothetical protein